VLDARMAERRTTICGATAPFRMPDLGLDSSELSPTSLGLPGRHTISASTRKCEILDRAFKIFGFEAGAIELRHRTAPLTGRGRFGCPSHADGRGG
jgi:hypothetical protein